MASTNINPFAPTGELPGGYPLSTSLDENNAQKAAAASSAYALKRMINNCSIVIAAANTPSSKASAADYVCDGVNDEVEINAAIASAISSKKSVIMLSGDYYLDAPTKTYDTSNDTFLLIDVSPTSQEQRNSLTLIGENAWNRAIIHVSDACYESLSASQQYRVFGIKSTDTYKGYVEMSNIQVYLPLNAKKIIAVDVVDFGGWCRLHSLRLYGYTSGYNGVDYGVGSPPPKAVEGCIGIKFIGKGPNGTYGDDMSNISVSGFHEGVCVNTEWLLAMHVVTTYCVYGWVFGKYTKGNIHAATHPVLLLICGDERSTNLPKFYANSGLQDIEMYAFSIERDARYTPGGEGLGSLATENTSGSFRGVINYTVYSTANGTSNLVNSGFWEYGHGHNVKTTDMSHAQAGTTALRNTYRPNYLQRYYDTTIGEELVCVDEQNNVWKSTMATNNNS